MGALVPHTDVDRFVGIAPTDVSFIEQFKESGWVAIYKVAVRGFICVMKVFRFVKRTRGCSPHREIDTFTNESCAYARLRAKEFCKRRAIPDFYGVIKQMDPALWQPHLDMFDEDETFPSAILIEYVPNMRQIELATFSASRMAGLKAILKEMHGARVLHDDVEPRNMMVQENSTRVLWIDVDCAQTFSEQKPLTPMQQEWMAFEEELMDEFARFLEEDYKSGKLCLTWNWYYD